MQSLGVPLDFSWDKPRLIAKIRRATDAALDRNLPKKSDEPHDLALYSRPPAEHIPQSEVVKALEKYNWPNLVFTFPTPDTIHFTHTITRESQTSLRAPLRDIIAVAKAVISGE